MGSVLYGFDSLKVKEALYLVLEVFLHVFVVRILL